MVDPVSCLGALDSPDVQGPTSLRLVAWLPDEALQSGNVRELSAEDVKFELPAVLKLGSLVELELTSDRHTASASVRGLIHWRQRADGRWLLGAFLDQPLTGAFVQHYWSDLRKELRYECRWVCGLSAPRDGKVRPATLVNYSRSGLMLEAEGSLFRGNEFVILDRQRSDGPGLVHGIVRWRSQVEQGRTLLGCELPDAQGVRLAAYLRTVGAYDDA